MTIIDNTGADTRHASERAVMLTEMETIIALQQFTLYCLQYGATLKEIEAIALNELERARKDAAKNQRRKFWLAGRSLVSAPLPLLELGTDPESEALEIEQLGCMAEGMREAVNNGFHRRVA